MFFSFSLPIYITLLRILLAKNWNERFYILIQDYLGFCSEKRGETQ